MRGIISWNGARSDQFGIEIEKYPSISRPQRKIDRYTVPGRNGDIIMAQDAWDNVTQRYEIIAGDGEKHSVHGDFDNIAKWLCAPTGYCELWDDFDPGHYRMAYFAGPMDISTLPIGRMGRATIEFNCKPQRYLISGKAAIPISRKTVINNRTGYAARPLIYIEGTTNGNGTLTIGKTVFSCSEIPDTCAYIDCEEMDCFDGNGTKINAKIISSTSEFAKLEPGDNEISFTGSITKVSITPRWYEI
ncbi:MAG: phage tail family protein [Clostridia bacterium]|nr:phage tail family protein [Clostridia bacterium]